MKKSFLNLALLICSLVLWAQKEPTDSTSNFITGIDWSMHPRYVPVNFTNETNIVVGYNRGLHKYENEYVNPSGYGVTLRAIFNNKIRVLGIINYRWEIDGNGYHFTTTTTKPCLFAGSATVNDVGSDCETIQLFPHTGAYTIKITATSTNSNLVSVYEKIIQLKDYLIVGMGDSFVSGEGNPDNNWLPTGITTGPLWLEPMAHRSSNGSIALIAAKLENDDPHSSVTFLNVATSGAKTSNGLLFQQHPDWQIKGQIEEVKDYIKDRKVDMVLMAIGLNDFGKVDGMSELIEAAVDPGPPSFAQTDELVYALDVLKNIQFKYLEVNQKILGTLNCKNVVLFQMPVQFMRNENGNLTDGCGYLTTMEDADILRLEDLGKQFINKQKEVCTKYGWTYIDGISNLFLKHGYCAGNQSWFVHVSASGSNQGNRDGSVHPNKTGYQKIAEIAYPTIRAKLLFAHTPGIILRSNNGN